MRFWITFLIITANLALNAQEVKFNGIEYEVKKETILKDGVDVTSTLTEEEKESIFVTLEREKGKIEEAKKSEKRLKKAEKEQKNAEKKRKKAEKELKQKERAQTNDDRASKKHEDAIKK